MSRYGRNQKRRHLQRIKELEAENRDLIFAHTQNGWGTVQRLRELEAELAIWKPKVMVNLVEGPMNRLRLCQEITRETLMYARDPNAVIDHMMDALRAEWKYKMHELRRL